MVRARPIVVSVVPFALAAGLVASGASAAEKPAEKAANDKPARVSFHKQVRPILQANCYGCHQPAKAKGGYVMTVFDKPIEGGEADDPAVVRGAPDKSGLYKLIVPAAGGEAEMPKGKKPLHA